MTSKKMLLVKTLEMQRIQEKLKQCHKQVNHNIIFCLTENLTSKLVEKNQQ